MGKLETQYQNPPPPPVNLPVKKIKLYNSINELAIYKEDNWLTFHPNRNGFISLNKTDTAKLIEDLQSLHDQMV